MASKFQNRLVGTVILVALGVILLPSLLDGNKRHYKDEFAAIPLVPKPGDPQEIDAIAPLNQTLPITPPVGGESEAEGSGRDDGAQIDGTTVAPVPPTTPQTSADTQQRRANQTSTPPVSTLQPPPIRGNKIRPETVAPSAAESRTTAEIKPRPETKLRTEPKPVADAKPSPAEEKPPVENKPRQQEQAPAGEAYIVQLGALKNADKANEIIATLRLSGYRAYTIPAKPVSGQITRIVVGPEASRQKLQASLAELNRLSGLNGQVRPYAPVH